MRAANLPKTSLICVHHNHVSICCRPPCYEEALTIAAAANAHDADWSPSLPPFSAGCLEWIHVSEAQEDTSDLPGSVPEGYWSVVLKDVKLGSESVLRYDQGRAQIPPRRVCVVAFCISRSYFSLYGVRNNGVASPSTPVCSRRYQNVGCGERR